MFLQIIILIAILTSLFVVSKVLKNPRKIKSNPQVIVKCKECGLNLPESEALQKKEYWYCCREHFP